MIARDWFQGPHDERVEIETAQHSTDPLNANVENVESCGASMHTGHRARKDGQEADWMVIALLAMFAMTSRNAPAQEQKSDAAASRLRQAETAAARLEDQRVGERNRLEHGDEIVKPVRAWRPDREHEVELRARIDRDAARDGPRAGHHR